jgi:hypothetical protein
MQAEFLSIAAAIFYQSNAAPVEGPRRQSSIAAAIFYQST